MSDSSFNAYPHMQAYLCSVSQLVDSAEVLAAILQTDSDSQIDKSLGDLSNLLQSLKRQATALAMKEGVGVEKSDSTDFEAVAKASKSLLQRCSELALTEPARNTLAAAIAETTPTLASASVAILGVLSFYVERRHSSGTLGVKLQGSQALKDELIALNSQIHKLVSSNESDLRNGVFLAELRRDISTVLHVDPSRDLNLRSTMTELEFDIKNSDSVAVVTRTNEILQHIIAVIGHESPFVEELLLCE